ncbi:HEAT repeat domain-containing protein, partial [Pseudomonas sp. 5P_3.1_Bac2]|uniref:HEAT repeat domain-containing protein n=1 Tax=Pseudomonas sp. 5P_3.1_Bac2 TaxID=2971617 RepID=UPI0021CAD72F
MTLYPSTVPGLSVIPVTALCDKALTVIVGCSAYGGQASRCPPYLLGATMEYTSDEQLDFIDSIDELDESKRPMLLDLTNGEDSEVRLRAIENISLLPVHEDTISCIRDRLNDNDELIRLACLEAIESYLDTDSLPWVRQALDDADWMVRGEAAIALSKLDAPDAEEVAQAKFDSCHNTEELVKYAIAMFISNKSKLSVVLDLYPSLEYRAKCATANLLADAIYSKWKSDR